MTTFTAWKFTTADGAEKASQILRQAKGDGLITVEDYAVIEWEPHADSPKVKYENRDDWRGAGWGALLGALVGAIFFLPLVGAAAGAAIGVLRKRVEAIGISNDQLETIGEQVVKGTSALFVVNHDSDLDRLAERFRGLDGTLVASNLVAGEEEDVRRAFEE